MEHAQLLRADSSRAATDGYGAQVVQVQRAVGSRQWTIKGIPPEAVEVSREAARRSGMKLNSWVTKALNSAAGVDLRTDGRPTDEESLMAQVVELEEYIKEQFARLESRTATLEGTINTMCSLLLKVYSQQPNGLVNVPSRSGGTITSA